MVNERICKLFMRVSVVDEEEGGISGSSMKREGRGERGEERGEREEGRGERGDLCTSWEPSAQHSQRKLAGEFALKII